MSFAEHTTVYTSFHVEDLTQKVEPVKNKRTHPTPLINNLFDSYTPPKTQTTTPINNPESEKGRHSSFQANNENYRAQYTPVVQYNFENALKPKKGILNKSAATEHEVHETLKQSVRVSNVPQSKKAKELSAIISQTPKEANSLSINLNNTAGHSRKISQNDVIFEW